MRIDFQAKLIEEPKVRVGFLGCGAHAFRNLFPALQFAPVELIATCDLDVRKAEAFARQFGAQSWYGDLQNMLDNAGIEAVFLCTGYDQQGRPRYPDLAVRCLQAGKHVWMEKPPAATCDDIDRIQQAAAVAEKQVLVGLKKMFMPANEKAHQLMRLPEFGHAHLTVLQYPQHVPTPEQFADYQRGQPIPAVRNFLDHLCHPASLLVYLMGMPRSLYYQRSAVGGGLASFTFDDGAVATLVLSHGASNNGGMERTLIVGEHGHHITIENNRRLTLHRNQPVGYGSSPSFFAGTPEQAAAVWEPEFSLGQLYNHGVFGLGYFGEIDAFARSILNQQPPTKGTLEQARQVTALFEGFAKGPGQSVRFE